MKKALAIFAAYYRRLAESAVGKFVLSTLHGARRTARKEDATPSLPPDPANIATADNTRPAARLSMEWNTASGGAPGETTGTEIANAFQWNSTASPLPSPSLHGGEGEGLAAGEHFPTDAIVTKSSRASTQENMLPAPRISVGTNEVKNPDDARRHPPLQTEPLPPQTFITRDELKRELDGLRRLMESRK